MVCRIIAVCVDCHDVELVSGFWSAALGNEQAHRWQDPHGLVYVEIAGAIPAFGRPVMMFQPVDGSKAGKNRVHVDLVVPAGESAADEIHRLVNLGARVVAEEQDLPWVVLADPEGNEFCVRSAVRKPAVLGRPREPAVSEAVREIGGCSVAGVA